jgi:hypothetical protein
MARPCTQVSRRKEPNWLTVIPTLATARIFRLWLMLVFLYVRMVRKVCVHESKYNFTRCYVAGKLVWPCSRKNVREDIWGHAAEENIRTWGIENNWKRKLIPGNLTVSFLRQITCFNGDMREDANNFIFNTWRQRELGKWRVWWCGFRRCDSVISQFYFLDVRKLALKGELASI